MGGDPDLEQVAVGVAEAHGAGVLDRAVGTEDDLLVGAGEAVYRQQVHPGGHLLAPDDVVGGARRLTGDHVQHAVRRVAEGRAVDVGEGQDLVRGDVELHPHRDAALDRLVTRLAQQAGVLAGDAGHLGHPDHLAERRDQDHRGDADDGEDQDPFDEREPPRPGEACGASHAGSWSKRCATPLEVLLIRYNSLKRKQLVGAGRGRVEGAAGAESLL